MIQNDNHILQSENQVITNKVTVIFVRIHFTCEVIMRKLSNFIPLQHIEQFKRLIFSHDPEIIVLPIVLS